MTQASNIGDCRPDDCCGSNATSLAVLVRCYRMHHRALRQMLEAFQSLKSLAKAIHFAAAAIDPTDTEKRMYRHQHRLGREFCEGIAKYLVTKENAIGACHTFADLKELIERETKNFSGFGKLAIYDTAVRIGAKKNIFPEFVYLHAGAKIGADNLHLEQSEGKVTINAIPAEFRGLQSPPLDNIRLCVYAEDFLCIYKNELVKLGQRHK